MDHMEHELKKEFQLERMILFSDAVFAIAITLLIIEIKIPELKENVSDKSLLHALGDLTPKFLGFIVSFWLIGLYWTVHHAIFGFVINYNRKLLWLNLAFLLTIVTMPFSTGFYSEYSGSVLFEKQLKVPMVFYVTNVCATGIFNFLLWNYISNPKNKLASKIPGGGFIQLAKARSLIVPLAFLLMLPIAYFIKVNYAVFMPALIPFYMGMIKKYLDKKYKKKNHPAHHN